ncbi:hypothetical protein HAX54_052300 [Datura stramonium]|uniref:Uncharacterized protein n=1 Tax=Datura stramonium TaxID=4076 RepID=A0ABS8WS60_DATST|nr:hypothetical protein [Datura stramonium]
MNLKSQIGQVVTLFSYTVSSGHTYGSVLLQSPSLLDSDQREMFCCSLFPGDQQCRKVFRKEVVGSREAIETATQWIGMNFIAGGGTNILNPLTQAMEMFPVTAHAYYFPGH